MPGGSATTQAPACSACSRTEVAPMPGIRVYGATATCRAPARRSARTAASTVRGDPAV